MKAKRHNEITELIKTREIGTQEELLDLLKTKGYDVTQSHEGKFGWKTKVCSHNKG